MSKARVKLNIKQLYRADGYAVKELLKISSLLYDAIQLDNSGDGDQTEADVARSQAAADVSLATKLEELREARNLATEIVESGSKLFTYLGRESELKESRDRALAFLDSISSNLGSDDPHQQIERSIRQQVGLLSENVADLERLKDDAEKSQRNLKSKIERKVTELERSEKRLKSLKKVKPAFSEEYEQLENELKGLYEIYLERFRNLQYLESELGKYHSAELEKKAESDRILKRMQKRLREEELRILRGDQPVDENAIDRDDDVWDSGKDSDDGSDDGSEVDSEDEDEDRRKRSNRGRATNGRGGRNVVGSMAGGNSDDDSEESDDDDDDDLGGGRGKHSDEDSDDLSDDDDLDSDDGGRSNKPGGGRIGGGGGGGMSKGPSGGKGRRDDDESEEPSDDDDDDDDDEAF